MSWIGAYVRPVCPLLRRVLALLLSLQPLIHPADDVLEALDAMTRLARTGELVRLAREADHHRPDLPVLERTEHHLAAVLGGRAVIGIAVDEHQRCRDVGDVRDR